ncbi:SRPBCC family protein [Streptomyces boninensis]|uniref:SRPBCC family protein n=1 Tax=Streptomyces boninensis TaxID=2039455 RepID=UPI003B2288BF
MNTVSRESRHVSVFIDRPVAAVYGYASDPGNLPAWAHGLSGAIEKVDGQWVAQSPMGRVVVAFAAPNDLGVLDHDVTLPSGETVYNPVRVLADGDAASEVVFTIRRRAEMSDDDLRRDAATVAADLERLKEIVESA